MRFAETTDSNDLSLHFVFQIQFKTHRDNDNFLNIYRANDEGINLMNSHGSEKMRNCLCSFTATWEPTHFQACGCKARGDTGKNGGGRQESMKKVWENKQSWREKLEHTNVSFQFVITEHDFQDDTYQIVPSIEKFITNIIGHSKCSKYRVDQPVTICHQYPE